MLSGRINSDLEALIEISVEDSQGNFHLIWCVLDTGFTGFLALPVSIIRFLELAPRGSRQTTLLSGTVLHLPVYLAAVDWQGESVEVSVLQTEQESLVGMALLENSTLTVQVWDGGTVTIEPR